MGLSINIFDKEGERHTLREWFVAPLEIIEEAIGLVMFGEIVEYRYDGDLELVVLRRIETTFVGWNIDSPR